MAHKTESHTSLSILGLFRQNGEAGAADIARVVSAACARIAPDQAETIGLAVACELEKRAVIIARQPSSFDLKG